MALPLQFRRHKTQGAKRMLQCLVVSCIFVLVSSTIAHAQSLQAPDRREPDETLLVEAGDIFEIIAMSDDPTVDVVWVLTQDRKFIEAGRDKVFRTRQVKPGEYLLDASVTEPLLGTQTRRLFLLHVTPHIPVDPQSLSSSTNRLFATFPPLAQSTIILPSNLQVVRFTPNVTEVEHFGLVWEASPDSTTPDTLSTFAYAQATPLHVWFTSPRERHMEALVQRRDGAMERETVDVLIGQPESLVSSQSIVAAVGNDGAVRFTLENPPNATEQVIVLWDFGDGMQSLQTSPTHTYATDGTYTITVSTRDLRTGEVLSESQTTINLQGIGQPSSSSSSVSVSSSSSSVPTVPSGPGLFARLWESANSGFIRVMLFILGGIVLLGLTVLIVLRLLRRTRLDATLESAEKALLKKEEISSVIDAPAAPLQVKKAPKKEAPPVVEAEIKEEKKPQPPSPPPPPQDFIDEAKAPSWLKKGLEKSPAPVVEPKPAPIVESLEPEPEPVPPLRPQPEPKIEPPAAPVEEPKPPLPEFADTVTPPWLEPKATPQSRTEPAEVLPTPVPTPEPPPEPKKEPIASTPPPQATPEPNISQPQAVAKPTTSKRPQLSEEEKLAKERERKRIKRQRYRDNLKKRKEAEKAAAPLAPIVEPPKTQPAENIAAPSIQEEKSKPATSNEQHSFAQPSPQLRPAGKASEGRPATEPPKALPPENFAEELPPASSARELPAPKKEDTSAPSATSTPSPNPSPAPLSDDSVAFIIKADSVSEDANNDHGAGSPSEGTTQKNA